MTHEYIIKVDDEKRDIMGGMPLEEQPKELVRCKDCKHWHDDGIITTCDKNVGNGFKADWFCADGEPKDGEQST